MFFCNIVSFPNLWQFDLKLEIHVNIVKFLLFVSFYQWVVDFHSILLHPIVQEGTCRNHSPVEMSVLSLASAIVSAITVVISSSKVLIRAWSSSVQFSSVAQSYPTLCNPMNRSTPGLPVHHHLPEFTQTQVHRVHDAIQPSHSWSSPSPPAPNPSQHQGLFQWVNSSHEVAKILEFQL